MRQGLLERSRLSEYLETLYREKLEKEESHVWNALVMVSTDLGFPEHVEPIRKAYGDGLANPGFEPLESVEKRLRTGEVTESELREYRLVDDTLEEMSWWACSDKKKMSRKLPLKKDQTPGDDDRDEPSPMSQSFAPTSGYRRPEPKIGRNDPCPCGSGKKYKKCCGG